MFAPTTTLIIAGTFLLAGTVKGLIGLGLPTVSLGLLSAVFDLPTAMALLIVPSLATNLFQALAGGNLRALIRRLWPFLAMAFITIWIGAQALTRIDLDLLSGLLGIVLVAYAVVSLAGFTLSIPSSREAWSGPLLGAVNGVLTGMTGSFVVPGVMFLQAIGLPRNMLVQAMGMLFLVSTLGLALALRSAHLMPDSLAIASLLAFFPALVGMVAGQAIRHRLSEARFRQVFFLAILVLGVYICINAMA